MAPTFIGENQAGASQSNNNDKGWPYKSQPLSKVGFLKRQKAPKTRYGLTYRLPVWAFTASMNAGA